MNCRRATLSSVSADPAGGAARAGVQDDLRPVLGPDLAVQGGVAARSAPTPRCATPTPVATSAVHAPFYLRGSEQTPAGKATAGDLVGAAKLTAATGATLAPHDQPVTIEPPTLPNANLAVTLVPATQNDDDKLSSALARLVDEDPALKVGHDPTSRRTVLRGVGDAHINVAVARLARKYGVNVKTDAVPIEFRRTVTQSVEVEGRLKKQSGGHGQFAVVNLRVSPMPRGAGFEFADMVVGGAIPKQYVAACRLGIEEAMARGGTEGIPVVDVKVECLDGKTHSVDSSDMAFRTAASTGFFEAVQKAGPALLEPISLITVEVPTELQGDVLGDLSSRRGRVVGSDVDSGIQTISRRGADRRAGDVRGRDPRPHGRPGG